MKNLYSTVGNDHSILTYQDIYQHFYHYKFQLYMSMINMVHMLQGMQHWNFHGQYQYISMKEFK